MRVSTRAALVAGLMFVAVESTVAQLFVASPPRQFDTLYRTYASGDFDIIRRSIRNREDYERIRVDMRLASYEWRSAFDPIRATFLLEMAMLSFDRHAGDSLQVLERARILVSARPRNAQLDGFETRFHRVALSLLVGSSATDAARTYVDAVTSPDRAVLNEVAAIDPWVALARATAFELDTKPGTALHPITISSAVFPLSVPSTDAEARRRIEVAIGAFSTLPDAPEIRTEARVRQALLLSRISRDAEALRVIDGADERGAALPVRYWRALVRGRVLTALARPRDAEAEYLRAAGLYPSAQTPAVALTALYLKQRQPNEAERWAAHARSRPETAIDPWWQYWQGPIYMVEPWLAELRRARP